MSGNKVIVDADALIGLINETDALHERCLAVSAFLQNQRLTPVIPYPVVLEAATALAKDKTIRRPDLARDLLTKYAAIHDTPLPETGIPRAVATLYDPAASKKNTPFDCYVLAFATIHGISVIFSFDGFYTKHGLTLAVSLLTKTN